MKCHDCHKYIDPSDGRAEWNGYCPECYPKSVGYRERMQLLHTLMDRLDETTLKLLHLFLDEMEEDHRDCYQEEVLKELEHRIQKQNPESEVH